MYYCIYFLLVVISHMYIYELFTDVNIKYIHCVKKYIHCVKTRKNNTYVMRAPMYRAGRCNGKREIWKPAYYLANFSQILNRNEKLHY